jgi:hypothetical protein
MENQNVENVENETVEKAVNQYNFCFVILRHVNSSLTNKYWIENCKQLRLLYGNHVQIVIIDDNSRQDEIIITTEEEEDILLRNIIIVESEFKGAGELLPYFYFLKYKWSERMVFLHDSVFLQDFYNFDSCEEYQSLWDAPHNWDNATKRLVLEFINKCKNNSTLKKRQLLPEKWMVCFGVMTNIRLDFLETIEKEFNFTNVLPIVVNRTCRMGCERFIPIVLSCNSERIPKSIFGSIFDDYKWGFTFEEYIIAKKNKTLHSNRIIKVWSGR